MLVPPTCKSAVVLCIEIAGDTAGFKISLFLSLKYTYLSNFHFQVSNSIKNSSPSPHQKTIKTFDTLAVE
jgi:hypothetical protein